MAQLRLLFLLFLGVLSLAGCRDAGVIPTPAVLAALDPAHDGLIDADAGACRATGNPADSHVNGDNLGHDRFDQNKRPRRRP